MQLLSKPKAIKQAKAKRLYVNQFYTIKATAATVGVTEKTISSWITKNNWKEAQTQNANKLTGKDKNHLIAPCIAIEDLRAYIEENSPFLAKKVNPLINDYLKLLS